MPPEETVCPNVDFEDEQHQNEFENDRIIDKYNLDVEWEEQQRLYKKWSDAWADAYAKAERADEYVKFVESKLDNDIRETWPTTYPDKKMTEAGVKAMVKGDDEYRQAVYDYISAKREVNILAGAMRSFDHRKTALEKLTDLDARNYFSRPAVNSAVREVVCGQRVQERMAETSETLAKNPRLEKRRKLVT